MELGQLDAGRGGGLRRGAGHHREQPGPGHRALVPAARARELPDRRTGRGPRLAGPGRGDGASTPPARSTPTWRRASSGPRRSRTRTSWRSAPPPRRASTASCARRAGPTASATGTSWRSSSQVAADSPAGVSRCGRRRRHVFGEDPAVVGPGADRLELVLARRDQEVLVLVRGDVDGRRQLLVGDVDEPVARAPARRRSPR